MAGTRTGVEGELEECVVVSLDTSERTHDGVVCGVVYLPSRSGDQYGYVRYEQICCMDLAAPMLPTVHMLNFLNVSVEHIIPQSARQACNLPDSDKWLAAEDDRMESIRWNKVPTHLLTFRRESLQSPRCSYVR